MNRPELKTDRLVLRQFSLTDKFDVQRLAGNPQVSLSTLNIPHPYTLTTAEEWITSLSDSALPQNDVTFAITLEMTKALLGGIRAAPTEEGNVKLGYWIGFPYWGCGYATEAVAAIIKFSFDELNARKIEADHLISNLASGRVMQKNAMNWVGDFQALNRDGEPTDFAQYEIRSNL